MSDTIVEKQDDLVYDLFNLAANDMHPINIDLYKKKGGEYLKEHTTQNIQLLMGKLFELPAHSEEDGLFATLPDQKVLIPREKPVPKEKKKTAWQEYAKEKGIRDIKKDKLVYDKVNDEFRPSFGWGRANNQIQNDWVIEEKANSGNKGGVGDADPFLEKMQDKKKKAKQQLKNQKRNMMKDQGASAPAALNIANIPKLNPKRARLELKNDLKEAYSTVAVSTASMGKFDKKLAKEPKGNKVKSKNKLSEKASMGNGAEEKSASLNLLDRVLKTQAEKKKKVRANAANTFQRVMESQARGKKRENLVGKNKARFGGNKKETYKKGAKMTGKKRSRSEVEF